VKDPRSTPHGPKPARYVPSSGFGYPLDGFLPRIPCRFCFAPAALLGFTLRRFPLPEGLRSVSAVEEPTYRWFRSVSAAKGVAAKRQTGLRNVGYWVRASRKCLATDRGLACPPLAPPMGFAPLGPATKALAWISPGLLSHASRAREITPRTRRRLRVSIGLRSAPPGDVPKHTPTEATLVGFLHLPAPEHLSTPASGL